MHSVELFAGAGGLAIGMAKAGFDHAAVVEYDHHACENFRENQRHHSKMVQGWPLFEMDARNFDYTTLTGDIDVVSGGPPCQPFSQGGKHRGQRDSRNMFPEAIRAIREVRPKSFIFENVKGFTRSSFEAYFSYIFLQLQHPEVTKYKGENWMQHRSRIEQHHTAANISPSYNVLFDVVNAANFGVPQRRQRVFIVGFRSDVGAKWSFPTSTHSEEALLEAKWISGSYWEEHGISQRARPTVPVSVVNRVSKLRKTETAYAQRRWRTVRDVLLTLPDPELYPTSEVSNHTFIPGARTYVGHTGSALDEPAKTLKAGYHGVPGGENMVVKDDGSVRYFTVREAAELQTFPRTYEFGGSWSQIMRQLGNAVPVSLAEVIARSVASSLRNCKTA